MTIQEDPHFRQADEAEKCAYCFNPTKRVAIATEEFVCDSDVGLFASIQGIPDSEIFDRGIPVYEPISEEIAADTIVELELRTENAEPAPASEEAEAKQEAPSTEVEEAPLKPRRRAKSKRTEPAD